MHVLRWGQSAYETHADLEMERVEALRQGFTWGTHPDATTPPELSGVGLLVVTSKVKVDAEVLQQVPQVLTTTSGYDHIDRVAARALGVRIGRCPVARRDAVVEHALGALIGLGKQWPRQFGAAATGDWCRGDLPKLAPLGLRGSTILIIGLGVIGRKITQVLHALDVTVLGVDPLGVPEGVEAVSLQDGLERCDGVTLHCSLTSTSTGLLDRAALACLSSHVVVVNTARGDSLDVSAAVDMVNTGRLRGLAVDVFPVEPYPQLAQESGPAVWFSPHSAGYAPDLGGRVAHEVGAAFQALAAGKGFPSRVD